VLSRVGTCPTSGQDFTGHLRVGCWLVIVASESVFCHLPACFSLESGEVDCGL
jgi:hypothetical protein